MEHLQSEDEGELLELHEGFDRWRETAERLDDWYSAGQQGPRPNGRIRPHHPGHNDLVTDRWASNVYRLALDPDGRPRELRGTGRF
jgi:hypothetical protein